MKTNKKPVVAKFPEPPHICTVIFVNFKTRQVIQTVELLDDEVLERSKINGEYYAKSVNE
jgi:hypothetical protein